MAKILRIDGQPASPPPPGLGDLVERLVKPIAVALDLPCLDENQQLRPESPCAQRRDRLNRFGQAVIDKIHTP